ncbi:MAG: hypothetical protein Q8O61_08340, partial [Nocardioides sp.]|nr:hypothetical protein [Nocardioides sp.]
HVDYLLLSTNSSSDLLSDYYSEDIDGGNPLLTEAYRTDRYVLLWVPDGFRPGEETLDPEAGPDSETDEVSP